MWNLVATAFTTLLAGIGAVIVAGGSLAVIAYGIFRYLGQKWLDAKFEERLAAHKHAQQRELEHLKFEISTLMDRTVRLHQREFDVLPEVWGRAIDAFNAIHPMALGFQEYPDLDKMSADQLQELIDKCPLAGWQKKELLATGAKTRYYADAMMWHKLADAGDAYNEFNEYFRKNGIFVSDEIKNLFTELKVLLLDAFIERRLSLRYKDQSQRFEKGTILHTQGPRLLDALEQHVQQRLWSVKSDEGSEGS